MSKKETSAELFARMFCDENGNTVEPPCTEDELCEFIESVAQAIVDSKEKRGKDET